MRRKHLFRRGAIWYFRIRIPVAMQLCFQTESLAYSLKFNCRHQAITRCITLEKAAHELFMTLKDNLNSLTRSEIIALKFQNIYNKNLISYLIKKMIIKMHTQKKLLLLFIIYAFAVPVSAKDVNTINDAVEYCVDFVRNSSGTDMEKYSFSKFDAYYNPATGGVADNVIYTNDQLSLFKFNKCMVNQGFPLKPKQ
jgi:hypothetical protein